MTRVVGGRSPAGVAHAGKNEAGEGAFGVPERLPDRAHRSMAGVGKGVGVAG